MIDIMWSSMKSYLNLLNYPIHIKLLWNLQIIKSQQCKHSRNICASKTIIHFMFKLHLLEL